MPPRTRAKESSKKRRHDEGGSSSGGVEGQSDLVAPGGRGLGHLNAVQLAGVEELQLKVVSGRYYFDFPLLDSYGCQEEVERLASQPYWEHLFSWRDDTYVPVVHEFIATFESTEDHWGTTGRFIGKKHNIVVIQSSALKALKLLLGLNFGGRHKNLHKIYRTDLFRLWSLEMNEPIQMACMVKQWLQTQAHEKCPYVWIGPIVTRLCEGLGLQRQLRRENRKATMMPLGLEQLSRSYIPKIDDVPMQTEEEPQQHAPEVGGQEVPPEYMQYPEVHDWASMRALQIQLHTHTMDTFNGRMDLQDEAWARGTRSTIRKGHGKEVQNKGECKKNSKFHAGCPVGLPRHTLERGETSRRGNEDSSSDEEEMINGENLNRGLMIDVEDLFRFRHFRSKEVIAWNYVDTPLLDTLGIRIEVERLANQPFWRNMCGWRNETYTPIVREFIATLEVNEEVHVHRDPSIKFKLFNKSYEISSDELGNLLGFYTLHDQSQDWYHNLLSDFENEYQPGLFWWCIARPGVTWSPSYTSARSTETPIHLGDLCRKLLRRQSHEDSENIFIGPLVSRLCEALGYGDLLPQESVEATTIPMNREDCLRLNVVLDDHYYDEHREREGRLLEAFQELGNRVGRLEEEVRRLRLSQQGEGPDDPRE
nr:hypothetical protein GOBAR_AA32432 [Ipomoea batatas]